MDKPCILKDFVTPDEFARHYGFSARKIRERARALGACCTSGKRMILLPHHCDLLLEDARPCPSPSTGAVKSGTTAELSPEGDFAALQVQRTKSSLSESRPKPKRAPGVVISMVRKRT